MQQLESIDALAIRQLKEWGEILSGWEMLNRYEVMDKNGVKLFDAGEQRGSLLARQFLGPKRPFNLVVLENGSPVLYVQRPFRFLIQTVDILDGGGSRLGSIEKTLNPAQRNYHIRNREGREVCELHGPFTKPWTFFVMQNGNETGVITKRWGGIGREAFTDADAFGVEFPQEASPETKALIRRQLDRHSRVNGNPEARQTFSTNRIRDVNTRIILNRKGFNLCRLETPIPPTPPAARTRGSNRYPLRRFS